MTEFNSPDWPFTTLKLGEYISLSRQAVRVVSLHRCHVDEAVREVLAGKKISELEFSMLVDKTRANVLSATIDN